MDLYPDLDRCGHTDLDLDPDLDRYGRSFTWMITPCENE